MSLDEILNLTTDVFSFYNNDERLGLFANISMYSHYVYAVLYSTRAAQNGILHQKDVDRVKFITTDTLYVLQYTTPYILQEYGCKDLLVECAVVSHLAVIAVVYSSSTNTAVLSRQTDGRLQ